MEKVILQCKSDDGELLQATYLPEKGMNLISYKKGSTEVIDQATKNLFDERFAGLGALIGPHFHHRNKKTLPPIPNEEAFSHIARLKAKGYDGDPFSHGIGRYAPWQYDAGETSIQATLRGSDTWNGVALKDLEGEDFTLTYSATLTSNGLSIDYSVTSTGDSLVGLHYYYALPEGSGMIISKVQSHAIVEGQKVAIPEEWGYDNETHTLNYPIDRDTDFTFHPYPDPLSGDIILDTGAYRLRKRYSCCSQENAWQCYHPKGATFVCIEPVSAQDPRHVNLTASSLSIELEIV